MAIKRRRFDKDSAQAEGVSYLLRKQAQLDTATIGSKGGGDYASFQGPIEVTYLVAAVDARAEIRALADFVCDGTDDHIEIQVALDELPASGGRIQLSEGTFSFDTAGSSNYHLQTGGGGSVTIAGVGHGTIIEMYGSLTYPSMNGIALSGYCTLEDLTIDLDNLDTNANFYAVTGNTQERIRNVRFINLNGGSSNYASYINAGQFNSIDGCTFTEFGRSGGPTNSSAVIGSTGTTITGCTFSGGNALVEVLAVDADGTVITGCTFSGCHVQTSSGQNIVSDSYFEDAGNICQTLLKLEGNFNVITGNLFNGAAGRTTITSDVAQAATYTIVSGNFIDGDMVFNSTNLRNLTIVGNHWYNGGFRSDTAAVAYWVEEVRIVENTFGGYNFGGSGFVWFTGTDRVITGLEISRNRVHTNDTGNLIDVDFDDDPASDFQGISIIVNDNYLLVDEDSGSPGKAVRVSGVAGAEHGGVEVCRNHLANPGDGILIENCQQVVVKDNVVELFGASTQVDNWASQLVVDGCVTAVVTGNSWRSALKGDDAGTGAAIYVQVTDSGSVKDNDVWGVVVGSLDTAIEVDGPALIEGNRYHGEDPQYTGTAFTNEIVVTGTGAIIGMNASPVDTSAATTPEFLHVESMTWAVTGVIQLITGKLRIPILYDCEIVSVETHLGTASTGSSVISDLLLDGSTVFTTPADRPTIAIASNSDSAVPNVTAASAGSYLTADVDQKDSNDIAADLTITVLIRRA